MKFRKKPVVIEAVQFTPDNIAAIKEFCGSCLGTIGKGTYGLVEAEIGTLEDGVHLTVKHIATEGDWIIKGVKGEFYACKPDIFEMTYELAPWDGQ
jgi:hypothetical protein